MATPLGHCIVGYLLARAAGIRSPAGLAAAVGAANLPDVDAAFSHIVSGDPFSLHRKITHQPVFPLVVGAATGMTIAVLGRGSSRLRSGLRAGALTAALVGSHVAMDVAPLPYDTMSLKSARLAQAAVTHAWNAVIDLTVYGALAMLVFGRAGGGRDQDPEADSA